MKNYVVGICSMFDNDIKLFPIIAESKYDAVKKCMVLHSGNNQSEIDWQNDPSYPTTFEGLQEIYEEIPFDVIEVGSLLDS